MFNNYLIEEKDYYSELQKNKELFNEKVVKIHLDAVVMPKKRIMKISRIAMVIQTEEDIEYDNNFILNKITIKILANYMKFEPANLAQNSSDEKTNIYIEYKNCNMNQFAHIITIKNYCC